MGCIASRDGRKTGRADSFIPRANLKLVDADTFYDALEGDDQDWLQLLKTQLAQDVYNEFGAPCKTSRLALATARERSERGASRAGHWLGTTLRGRTGAQRSTVGELERACMCLGTGADLKLQSAGFAQKREEQLASASWGSMYECVSCDALRAKVKIQDVVGRLVPLSMVPRLETGWTDACPLPRVICINLQLPYTMGSDDPGCSFVSFFHIRPEVVKDIQGGHPSPYVSLFERFCGGPGGRTGAKHDPNRSLGRRLDKKVTAGSDLGLLMGTVRVENAGDLHAPSWMRCFNDKPVPITKSGYIVRANPGVNGPPGEWLELGIDVRQFNWFARQALLRYRKLIPEASMRWGFMIRSEKRANMPESLLCDMYTYGIDMEHDPLEIEG